MSADWPFFQTSFVSERLGEKGCKAASVIFTSLVSLDWIWLGLAWFGLVWLGLALLTF